MFVVAAYWPQSSWSLTKTARRHCRRKPIRRRIFDGARDNGLVICAFANGVLGYAPPLCCTDEDIDGIIERTRMTLEEKDVRTVMKG
jgi:adenosylmethionine-8-amino-7-oxononanoate aminotransferase